MVRRKRKGLVKESLVGDAAAGAPPAADVRAVLRDVPLNAVVPFLVETDTKKPRAVAESEPPLELAAWFADSLCGARTRFEQLRALQAFRAGVKRLTGAEPGFAAFAEATWRLFARLHGDASLQPLQKNFALVLNDLAALHMNGAAADAWPIEAVAREELRAVLAALWAATGGDADAVARRINHLQSLLDVPFLLHVLVRDSDSGAATSTLRRTVQFLADQLTVLVAPIAEYQAAHGDDVGAHANDKKEEEDNETQAAGAGSSSATNAVLIASERASVALKCIIVLGSLKETLYEQLIGGGDVAFADTAVDVGRLLDHCTLILKTRVVHKDLLTQTGLAYCLVLRVMLLGSLPSGRDASATSDAIQLLFNTVYQSESPLVAALADGVRDHVTQDMRGFSDFARLAVLRGFVNSLSEDELTRAIADVRADADAARSILDFVFHTVHDYCGEESLNTRLYAFQVLEAFLRRAVGVITKRASVDALPPIAQSTVANLTSAVLLNWENPSKRVNQFMHLMFTHIVNFQVLAGAFDAWKVLAVARLTQLPRHSRARYGGLSILVPQYGAATLLAEHPGLLQSILYAVGIKDVSAAAAALFTQILDELNTSGARADETALAVWRAHWMGDLVDVLLSDNAKLRSSVAMYALPLLLKKDPACVGALIDKLRAQGAQLGSIDVALWAIIEVLKFARRKIAPENLLGLSVAEIQQGLEHTRADARGAAFEALCASLKSTHLPTPAEMQLIKRFLVVSAKEITAATRVNSLNGLKTVFFRVKEFVRVNDKAVENPRATEEEKAFVASEVARAKAFQSWVELFVVTTVYPGSLVQRSIVGLEVLLLHLQVFGAPAPAGDSLLMTPHMVTCLLNMLIGSWDVVRAIANAILDLYPAELPGYTTRDGLERLWHWAMTLCVSPRQRESDAGAHFLLLLYSRSASLAAHDVAELPASLPNGAAIQDARVRIVLKLTDMVAARLAKADLSRGESPLVHGLLLAVRYIIDNTAFAPVQDRTEWRYALARVFQCVHESMKLSLAVVGDATSGVGDEKLSDAFEGGVVGEVSAAGGKTEAIPLRVDCRGHLILEDSERTGGGDGGDGDDDDEQRAVVGSWLAARECGAIVDMIMRRVPLPTASNDDTAQFFAAEQARQCGEMLLNSLFELKHKGAVATAYEAFEGVCKSFLAHGEKNAMIGGLPSAWADRLLDRLERSEQQFILRRSSGFAYSFVAILRAEPRNTAAIILPRVMSHLLRLASQDTDAMAAAAAAATGTTPQAHLGWRARVHALNILKLIAQDAVLADDVAVYVAQMLEFAIFGFECRSWVVRNSSMMLFAAATQRALGDKRVADGASKNKIPSAEVFSRFPQLAGFLFRALDKFTRASIAEGVVPPGLFPVLMFLSRLRPTDELEDAELRARGSKPLADFVPLVLACASQSVLPIRDMAAKVLGSIVRVDMALPLLQQLSTALPSGVRPTGSPADHAKKPLSANHVHGVLLQAQSLIAKCLAERAAASASVDMAAVDAVLAYVTTTFVAQHLWLASPRVKCASIRAVAWEIVEAVSQFAAQHPRSLALGDELTRAVTAAALEHVDALTSSAATPSAASEYTRAPGDYNCHRAVVGTFFSLLQLHWKPTTKDAAFVATWVARLEALLQCPVLEARKRAFKKLAKFLEAKGESAFNFAQESAVVVRLQRVLLAQLVVETHPTVKTRLLELLLELQDSRAASKAPALAADAAAVDAFLELLANSADVKVVGPALQLLASAARDGAQSETVLRALRDNVLARSAEAQPLGLRFAAAVAIERSDLLVAHVALRDGSVDIAVDAWSAAVRLLQDDDSHVRGVARTAVHRALLASVPGFALAASVSETALLPHAVRFVVRTFASSAKGVDAVRALVREALDVPRVLVENATGAKAQDWGDLSKRIFEAEGNNFYVEPDLVAQVVATCVFEDASHREAFGALQRELLEALREALALLNESHAREQWLGGLAYYVSVFPSLFSLLTLGVAALDADVDESLRAEIQREAALALPFVASGHPLVAKAVAALAGGERVIAPRVVRELVFLSPDWAAIQ